MDNTSSESYEYQIYNKHTHTSSSADKVEVRDQGSRKIIDHTLEYKDYFMDVQIKVDEKILQCNNQNDNKRKHKIITMNNQNLLSNYINFKSAKIFPIGSLYNGLIIKYQVFLGNFKISVNMINQNNNAPIMLKSIGQGAFGEIFIISISNEKSIACKRTRFRRKTVIWPQNQQGQQFRQAWEIRPNIGQIHEAILEYSIYRICSFYKIGPSTVDCMGFDLVCFNDAIQFYMQHCSRQFDSQNYEEELKICTRILHRMKIIHKDIKPSNILYSQTHQSYIITDFGISHPVQQQPGQLTQTYQEGTHGYMSPEMTDMKKDKPEFIDLYYNDLYALKTSLAEIKCFHQRSKVIEQQQQIKSSIIRKKKIHIQYMVIKLIFMILNSDEQKTVQLIKEYNLYKIFFQQLQYLSIHSLKYRKLRQKLIDHDQKFLKYRTQINQQSFFSKKKLSKQQIQFMVRTYGMTQHLNQSLMRFEQNWRIRNILNSENDQNIKNYTIYQYIKMNEHKLWYIKTQEKYLQILRRSYSQNRNNQLTQIINTSFLIFYQYIKQRKLQYAQGIYQQILEYRNQFSAQQMVQYEFISLILQYFTSKQKNYQKTRIKFLDLIKIYPKETLLSYNNYFYIMIWYSQSSHVIEQYQLFIQHEKTMQLTLLQKKQLISIKVQMLKFELQHSTMKKLIDQITQLKNTIKQYNLQEFCYHAMIQIDKQFYIKSGEHKKEIQKLQEHIRFMNQIQGQNSYFIIQYKISLANCYFEINELQKSEMYILETIQQVQQFYGQNNFEYLKCLTDLISLHSQKNSVNKVSMYYRIWSSLIYQFHFEQKFYVFQINNGILHFYFQKGLVTEIQKILLQLQQKLKNKSQTKHYHYLLILANYYNFKADTTKFIEIKKQLTILNKSLFGSSFFIDINFFRQYTKLYLLNAQYDDEDIMQFQFICSQTNNKDIYIQCYQKLGKIYFKKCDYKHAYYNFNTVLALINQPLFKIQILWSIIDCLIGMKQFDNAVTNILKVFQIYQDQKILVQQKQFNNIKQKIIDCYIHSNKANIQKKMVIQILKKMNPGNQGYLNGISYHQNLIFTLYANYYIKKIYIHAIYYLEYLISIYGQIPFKLSKDSVYTLFYQKYKFKKQRALKHELLAIKSNLNADLCYKYCRLIKFYKKCDNKTIILILLTFLFEKVCKCKKALVYLSLYKSFEKQFKYRICNEIMKTGKLNINDTNDKISEKMKKICMFKKIKYLNRKLRLTSHKLE